MAGLESLNILKDIDLKLSDYPDMSLRERHELLSKLSMLATLNFIEGEVSDESICPYTKESLRVPCGLKKCMYWNPNPWVKNCSLNFLLNQKNAETLSISQVSLLYGKSPKRVESIYKKCFKIVQRHYLKSVLRERKIPQFKFIKDFCVTCQSTLLPEELENESLRLNEGFGYCSTECKKQYPPQYFDIELFFESDFFKIIEVGSELFNFYYLEEVLGFQQNVLRNRLEKIRDGKKSKMLQKS